MPRRHLTDRSVSRVAIPELDPSRRLLARPIPQSVSGHRLSRQSCKHVLCSKDADLLTRPAQYVMATYIRWHQRLAHHVMRSRFRRLQRILEQVR